MDYENDTAPEKPGASRPWLQMISDAEKAFQVYQDKCASIERIYGNLKSLSEGVGDREFQIFWANLEVLKPTIYQRPPRPVVMPRHSDLGELVRKASEVMERALEFDVEWDDLHDTLQLVRDDLAMNGRGVPWVLDNGTCIHVDRHDFLHEPARKWKEVDWVARRAYLTRDQGVERFGEAFWDAECAEVGKDRDDDYKGTAKKAEVWELWCKSEGKVVWVTEGVDEVLDEAEPLVDVKGFFPCPKPAYSTLEPGTLLPIPDFVYYRDQVDEINEMTARISALAESLRLKGFYAAGASEIGEAIETAMRQTDNKALLVPVSNFAALGGGSLKDSIIWLPVQEIAAVVQNLVLLRKQLIEDVYEITGLSDIMRGQTAASETATAQNLKAQYGSVRVRERQGEMVRVALDVLRIKAEIFAENYPIEQVMQMAAMQLPTQQQVQQMAMQAQAQGQPFEPPVMVEQVDQLFKSQRMRPFLMDVETDSTIMPDEQAEKQSRIEFITAIGQFIQQAGQMVAAQPESAPFAGELMKFTAGGFRAGRDLGGAIDDFVDQVKAKAAQSTQGPSPQEQAMQAQMQADQQAKQAEMQVKQAEMQIKRAEMEAGVVDSQQQRQLDAEKLKLEARKLEIEAAKVGLDSMDREANAVQRTGEASAAIAEAIAAPFAAISAQIQQGNTAIAEQIASGDAQIVRAMTADKQVVRDASGRAVGVRTVQ